MKANFKIEKPDELQATLTITMKVSEWKALRASLDSSRYVPIQFSNLVSRLVLKGSEQFDAIEEWEGH